MKIALVLCLGLLVLGNAANVYAQDESSTTVASTVASSEASSSTVADVTSSASSEATQTESEATSEGSGSSSSDESTSSVNADSTTASLSTEASSESSTKASSEASTEASTGSTSEVSTEASTESSSESSSEGSTKASTESSSEGSTEASTESSSEGSTEASTESSSGTTTSSGDCLSETEMWGEADIYKFNFCDNGVVITEKCDEDYYYVNNGTVSGCIPTEDMNPNCVNLDASDPVCQGENLKQPQPSTNLTNFYLCPKLDATASELPCVENTAFINQDGYLGCFQWEAWRKLRDCPQ